MDEFENGKETVFLEDLRQKLGISKVMLEYLLLKMVSQQLIQSLASGAIYKLLPEGINFAVTKGLVN